jgi:ABC-type transporter Mla MlaB component
MPAPPLAHLGHWYVSLPIFMGPVLAIALALKIQTWREHRRGPDTSGKRSTLTIASSEGLKTTIAIAGPLDYSALVELESALATNYAQTQAITLDLRKLTEADQESAWSLCDAIGRTRDTSSIEIRLGATTPSAETLVRTLTSEGISVSTNQRHTPLP